jgi:hypothetical protein
MEVKMKVRVDKEGILHLQRTDKLRKVYCPHDGNFCSDACALFDVDFKYPNVIISLCTKEYVIENEEFTDERPRGVEYDD